MTLIEMIIYIALLTIILFGSVFSAYSMIFSQQKTQDKIEQLNTNERGFIALISVLIISSALLVAVLTSAESIGIIFDEANHKQSRVLATQAALFCLDKVFIELEHDYFYTIASSTPTIYTSPQCSILFVGIASSNLNAPGPQRIITVKGQSAAVSQGGVVATITAQVLINSQNISLMSSAVIF